MRHRMTISAVLGLGMLASVQAQPQPSVPSTGQSGVRSGIIIKTVWFLVLEKSVQADLKVTPDQAAKLQEWSPEFVKKIGDILRNYDAQSPGPGIGKDGKLTEEDRLKLRENTLARSSVVSKAAFTELGGILNKEQIKRLKQIENQGHGLGAFEDPDVLKLLKPTEEQKERFGTILAEYHKKQADLRQSGLKDSQSRLAKSQELHKEYLQKMLDTLTAEQKQTWKSLLGEPFDFSQATSPGTKKD